MGIGGYIFPGLFAIGDATSRIKNGEGVMPSIAKASGTALITDTIFGLMGPTAGLISIGGTVAVAATSMLIERGKNSANKYAVGLSSSNMSNQLPNVINSKNATTMRQRGMSMINENGEVTRSALGNEARAYFRNNVY